ncbi:MAG: flavodoxin family protein [Alphaproteobacteria bacterium]|nr:flavodoxin family protein [Alphaproteobacteria bacterium]
MKNILIIYGTTTGNSEKIAHMSGDILANNFSVSIKNCADLPSSYAFDKDIYLFATSTWGINPASLQEDFEIFWLQSNKKSIFGKKFVLLGLGDDSYPFFCGGIDILETEILENGGIVLNSPLKINDSAVHKRNLLEDYLQKTLDKI